MTDLSYFIQSRKFVRKSVTETYNNRQTISVLEWTDRLALRTKLNENKARLNDLDQKIRSAKWANNQNEAELEDEFKTSESYENKIRTCLAILEPSPVPSAPLQTPTLLKCPTAPLPTFSSHVGEDLTRFLTQFEAIINKYSYSDYEKLLLLKQQVSGRALILIDSLESHNQGYDNAKNLLQKALASPEIQTFNTIKQLCELKLDSCDDPFEYISRVKGIRDNVRKLNISVDSFLQYFVWSGLTESFKNLIINITNHTWPSINEICDHYFTACDRYVHTRKKRERALTTDLAVNIHRKTDGAVGTKSFPCSLCSTDSSKADHNIRHCVKFTSPESKVLELKRINGCTRCGFSSHSTKNCRYKFRDRCINCHDFHWHYLCIGSKDKGKFTPNAPISGNQHTESKTPKSSVKSESKSAESTDKKNEESKGGGASTRGKVSGNVVSVTEALNNYSGGNTILPTFTCEVKGQLVRGMKDSGCQSNFVSQELVDSMNLPVIEENVKLTVKGINVPKQYDTKIVEFEMGIGKDSKLIQAVCIPSIEITLELEGLSKVVAGFTSKGYSLVDDRIKYCKDEISDIQIILGSKSSYCIPESEVTFGNKNQSLYSDTPYGIMLKGDVNTLLNDLPYLPYAPEFANYGGISSFSLVSNPSHITDKKFSLASNLNFSMPYNDENFSVFDDDGEVIEQNLTEAATEILESVCDYALHRDNSSYSDESIEVHNKLVEYTLNETSRNDEGRLVMPILWNSRVSHLLGQNFNLAKQILLSLLRKYRVNDYDKLTQIDQVFKDQRAAGIIELVQNLDQLLSEHPEASFLPFMGIFKPDRETTKCRIVFLSNLCERKPNAMSHNQTMHAGPPINQKLSSSIIHLRFGKYICCFDLKKAFNQIGLEEVDQNRLLFLWFKNISKQDFSIVGYRNCRLPFGLRCSPTILMLGMYKMLVMDSDSDSPQLKNLKNLIYQLSYMDNCAFTAESTESLRWMYEQLDNIFSPYKFGLQQFMTNDISLQEIIDGKSESETSPNSKLLGLQWNKLNDTLSTKSINLDEKACTKRQVLSTIASQFDLLNFNGPLINRARLFLHRLQCEKQLDWDETLSADQCKEWKNIVRQVNSAPPVSFPRNFGSRNDHYKLVGFADSSKLMFGSVIYIQNLITNKMYYVLARNKLVNRQLESKSIPSLELQALALATETVVDLKNELSGSCCINPITIDECEIYSDSLVALTWLQSYSIKLDKMQKKTPFIHNRLEHINKLCESNPIRFSFIAGGDNPADCITRPMSHKQLMKSNYISGPSFITDNTAHKLSMFENFSFILPGISIDRCNTENMYCNSSFSPGEIGPEHAVSLYSCFNFSKVARVHENVIKFCNIIKGKLKAKHSSRFDHLETFADDCNTYDKACKQIILRDQQIHFPDVFEYFNLKDKTLKKLPNIVSQLNLYLDPEGLIRVKSKCRRMKEIQSLNKFSFPLLISKNSHLSKLVIRDLHLKLSHAGCYSVLAELRKNFWITHVYSTVKKVLSDCLLCKRLNERAVKLNQSPYPEFRINPDNVPYRQIFIDHMGPFKTKNEQGETTKVWLLCITCLWSRAINLKICNDLSTGEFLRALQLHAFEYGVPSRCLSDLGSQFVAGGNSVSSFLNDHETVNYFNEHGISPLKFEQYTKGCNKLGSLVESCVKLTKRLLYGAMRNNILSYRDFEFIVQKTIHLVNRRPISFRESLRDTSGDQLPEIITPEMLVHCRELFSINLIPQLQPQPDPDPDFDADHIDSSWCKLQRVRYNLVRLYNEEFIGNLIYQAINQKDRYKPVKHKNLSVGDIVLIKEPLLKPGNYPLGRIKEIVKNCNDEITGVTVMKGKNRELLKRHSSTIIPLLSIDEDNVSDCSEAVMQEANQRPQRKAAIESASRTRQILQN